MIYTMADSGRDLLAALRAPADLNDPNLDLRAVTNNAIEIIAARRRALRLALPLLREDRAAILGYLTFGANLAELDDDTHRAVREYDEAIRAAALANRDFVF